jgi:hypothetical protein
MSRIVGRALALCGFVIITGRAGSAQQPNPAQLAAVVKTPTRVRLDWAASPTAKGYWVQRAAATGGFSTINTAKLTTTWYADADALAGVTLRYRVKAVYQTGSPTFSPIATVATPALATETAAVPSTPTLAPFPVVTETLTWIPPKTAPLSPTPQPQPDPAPAPTAVVSGKYRIVANGFSVIHETYDDMLSRDGKFDEVYGGFLAFHYDRRTGTLLDRQARRTKTLGDIANFSDRIRAGSGNGPNGSGGLRSGDSYPDAAHARSRGPGGTEPNDVTFPFKIWEGTLTDAADAAVILPTMWERDQDEGYFWTWQQDEINKVTQIWWDPAIQAAVKQTGLGVLAPPGSTSPDMDPDFFARMAIFAASAQPWMIGILFAPDHDQPIGMGSDAGSGLPRRAVVLTREIIEHALNTPPTPPDLSGLPPQMPWLPGYFTGLPAGVIPVLLMDRNGGPPLQAISTEVSSMPPTYVLYLQVERM